MPISPLVRRRAICPCQLSQQPLSHLVRRRAQERPAVVLEGPRVELPHDHAHGQPHEAVVDGLGRGGQRLGGGPVGRLVALQRLLRWEEDGVDRVYESWELMSKWVDQVGESWELVI